MKALLVLPLALACLAGAQTVPRLDAAQAVDIRVKTVTWHPSGDTLLYSRDEGVGVALGLYRLGDPEGTVVLHLGKGDRWHSKWFAGSDSALVTVFRALHTPTGDGNQAAVYLLDGLQRTATELYSRIVPASETISIDTDLSPSLTHAICRIHVGETTSTAVLPISGKLLVAAPEIDAAEAKGLSGPSWSRNGTAIYADGLGGGVATLQADGQSGRLVRADGTSGTFLIKLTAVKAEGVDLDLTTFRLVRPAPPAGTPVLEVVPTNGALRQVRSPGPWVNPPPAPQALATDTQRTRLEFGRSQGDSNTLWLRRGSKSQAQGSVLVAAHAQSAALAPGDQAIAYTTDGALFVRRVVG